MRSSQLNVLYMKKLIIFALLSLANINAWASPELANKNNCFSCHALDTKIVGPSFLDIAKKYLDKSDAEIYLTNSIKAGGIGKWGQIPMPLQAQLNDADANALAAWILGGAK